MTTLAWGKPVCLSVAGDLNVMLYYCVKFITHILRCHRKTDLQSEKTNKEHEILLCHLHCLCNNEVATTRNHWFIYSTLLPLTYFRFFSHLFCLKPFYSMQQMVNHLKSCHDQLAEYHCSTDYLKSRTKPNKWQEMSEWEQETVVMKSAKCWQGGSAASMDKH